MNRPPLSLVRQAYPDNPALGTAVSRAILNRVAAGELPPTLRLHRPGPILAFSRQDRASPGFAAAVRAAREAGFEPVLRLAGGRAAVFHERTLACSWAVPDARPAVRTTERFLVGIGQRLIAGAAHRGAVVVVGGSDRIRDVLVPVYDALGLDWDPATAGSVEDERGEVGLGQVEEAILARLRERHGLSEEELDAATLELAEQLELNHRVEA